MKTVLPFSYHLCILCASSEHEYVCAHFVGVLLSTSQVAAVLSLPYLGHRISRLTGPDCCHDFLFLPQPEVERPLRAPCLANQVLGVRGKGHADKLLHWDVSSAKHFPLPALLMLQVVNRDGGLLPTLRHCQVASVGTDGQSLHALALLCALRATMRRDPQGLRNKMKHLE